MTANESVWIVFTRRRARDGGTWFDGVPFAQLDSAQSYKRRWDETFADDPDTEEAHSSLECRRVRP